MYFEVNHTCKVPTNLSPANNSCYSDRGRLSMHHQPGYVGNCDICTKSVVTWQEHHSGVGGKIQLGFLCILRECSTVGWIVRAGWTQVGSGCDTVHTLSRAVGEGVNEQCCHKHINERCGTGHYASKHVWLHVEKLRMHDHTLYTDVQCLSHSQWGGHEWTGYSMSALLYLTR